MIEYIMLIAGLFLLVKGADWLIDGSSKIAKTLGIKELIVGLTIVAFGTSMPELFVNIFAAIDGNANISFGNIIGSNIANILLILGLSAVLVGVQIHSSIVWRELPLSFFAALLLLIIVSKNIFGFDSIIGIFDGITLLIFFSLFMYYIFASMRNQGKDELKPLETKKSPIMNSIFFILIGVVGLYFGGRWTVDGVVSIARQFNISEFIISSTVVAVGTSLPELVTSIKAAIQKNMDIAVGNIVGSNIFNISFVMGISFLIKPVVAPAGIFIDLIFLLLVSSLLFAFMFTGKKHYLDKWEGAMLLLVYAIYVFILIQRGV
jgi:cation:H+ antiporter